MDTMTHQMAEELIAVVFFHTNFMKGVPLAIWVASYQVGVQEFSEWLQGEPLDWLSETLD